MDTNMNWIYCISYFINHKFAVLKQNYINYFKINKYMVTPNIKKKFIKLDYKLALKALAVKEE
jgi:hypothetical protein